MVINLAGDCQDEALAARSKNEHGEVDWQAGPAKYKIYEKLPV